MHGAGADAPDGVTPPDLGDAQLELDFEDTLTQRSRRAKATRDLLPLFATWVPNMDVSLHSPTEAIVHVAGKEVEEGLDWVRQLSGSMRRSGSRKGIFPISALSRMAFVRPPANVTLDAAASAVAFAQHAHALGLKPVKVHKQGRRIVAASPRGWPPGLKFQDAPWSSVECMLELGLPLSIDPSAKDALAKKLTTTGRAVASASMSGNSVLIETSRPELLESIDLPGLSYIGDPGDGTYKLPLMLASSLLDQPMIQVSEQVAAAAKRVSRKPKPMIIEDENFPWQLWDFQSDLAGRVKRHLQVQGGSLIAADMGSGKTTISLAVVHEMDLWPLLVVAPNSAFSTWARQLTEMGRSHMLFTGSPKENWEQAAADFDAYVVSYDRLATFSELLQSKHPQSIIADEVQRIRNPGSGRSRSLRALSSSVPNRIGLSGTPLVNGLQDVLSIGAFLAPGEWSPRATKKSLEDRYPGDPVEAVSEHLHSMMVRLRMDQVGKPIASRVDRRVYVNLTVEQQKAITTLEEEIKRAKQDGEFDGSSAKFNALVKLGTLRKIVSAPRSAGVPGPNPKLAAGMRLVQHYLDEGRAGVVFCADRTTFADVCKELEAKGVRYGGMSGSTSAPERIEVERRLHTGEIQVVVATIQSSAESWSASPTATWLVALSGLYQPAILSQMEARVHRLNSRLEDTIEITYVHAKDPSGSPTVDDRMLEIVNMKKELSARVIDRRAIDDESQDMSLADLLYMLTGSRDEAVDAADEDRQQQARLQEKRKQHAKDTIYRGKNRNKEG